MIHRSLNWIISLALLLSLGGCQSLYQNEWSNEQHKNGIQFHTRAVLGSRIPEFRGVVTTQGTVQDMLDVLMDVASYPEWVYQCEEAQIIETNGFSELHIYQVNKPPLVKTRDIILLGKIEPNTGTKLLRIHMQARPNYCDNKDSERCHRINQSKHLRVTKSSGVFEARQLTPDTVQITWQQHMEPGGLLPAWLVNNQLDNLVFKTLAGLQDQLKHASNPKL